MAEATVESPPCTATFFCHECLREVQPNIPAYTCSRCNGGFIEEMERRPSAPTQSQTMPIPYPATHFAEMLNNAFLDPLSASGGPGTMWGSRHRYNTRQASQAANNGEDEDREDSDEDDLRGIAPNTFFHFNSGSRDRNPGQQTLHGIINYVIQRLGSDLGNRGQFVHLHGNPGDYAWGSGGLDAIVSQLLNQLEGTGAPPAPKEKIDSLPTVVIQQSHVDDTLQCSVCMDDFNLGEEVRKLPCDHLYHAECVIRWLEMHGTCPVCRKDLNGADHSSNDADFTTIFPPNSSNDGGNGASSSSSSSSSTSMGPSTSSSFFRGDNQ